MLLISQSVEHCKMTTKQSVNINDSKSNQHGKDVVTTRSKEFGGTLGASCMIAGLPLAILGINSLCNKTTCTIFSIPALPSLTDLLDRTTFFIYIAWFGLQLLLSVLPCGTVAKGLPLKTTGKQLSYRCNGFFALLMSTLLFLVLLYLGVPVTYVYQRYLALMTSAILFSILLSIYLYARSHSRALADLAEGGNTGSVVYDFFIGRELNPRVGPVDLKFFCELRPGLIGWVMLDFVFVAEAWKTTGTLGSSSMLPLLLVVAFHFLYVADALWHEEAILTTMDIVHDGFGLMLALGDLAWVPFLYTLQARFILEHPQQWTPAALLAILALNMTGFVIFRKSNSQKNDFRQNPNSVSVKHLKTLTTESGSRLIVSGWWGLSRHPNYMGDLIMALSWSMVTGFQNILPYFYPIYFLGLLIHRSMRDDHNCRRKYGKDWQKYCELVPYRIFPYLY